RGLEAPVGAPPADEEEGPKRASELTPSRRGTPPTERSDDDAADELLRPNKESEFRRKRFRDYQPHRGPIILVLGIIAIVTGLHLILGPIAWIMGNNDLKEIHAGRMDPEGEGMTNIGRILGMVATILGIVAIVLACIFAIIWLMIVFGILGAAAGASRH
ncbi:MAG TPA: hypothetical protein VGG61_09190, partial [Gemmataceae bacterium]